MGPEYDIAMMLGDMILVFLFFWFFVNLGFTILEQLYTADARLVQEQASGFLSMSSFAPDAFVSNQTFPAVSHIISVLVEPQLIAIKTGSSATVSSQIGGKLLENSIRIMFTPRPPLGYTLSNSTTSKIIPITLRGSCIDYCELSSKNYNVLRIRKEKSDIFVELNKK